MKKTIYLLSFLFVVGLLIPNQALCQRQAYISGPSYLCEIDCGTYEVVDTVQSVYEWVLTSDSGASITLGVGDNIGHCFGQSDGYILEARDLQTGAVILMDIFVEPAEFYSIQSDVADLCPSASSISGCRRVCSNSTVTYWYPDLAGVALEWSVSGDKSHYLDGDRMVVDWGEGPARGTVSAQIDFGGRYSDLAIMAQQIDAPDPNSQTYSAHLAILRGFGPFQIIWSDGYVETTTDTRHYRNDLSAGTYQVTVVDPNNVALSVSVRISTDNTLPKPEFLLNVQMNGGSCASNCDGFIRITGQTPSQSGPFAYAWNNGYTTAIVTGLCDDTNGLILTDSYGQTTEAAFYSGCYLSECTFIDQACITVLEDPRADFTAEAVPEDSIIQVCKGQTVYFQNQSEAANTYLWEFGLAQTSEEEHPAHVFNSPGTYEVALIAYNACGCADTAFQTVVVQDAVTPLLDCLGTVCAGEVITYTTSTDCNIFRWVVSANGVVVEGGGPTDDYITIDWQQGGEGVIELLVDDCVGDACRESSVFKIPIIDDDATIVGPDLVCPEELAVYSVPAYSATTFEWSLPQFNGSIVDGQGTNEVTVRWRSARGSIPQIVRVVYDNCYLGCSGSAEKEVLVRDPFYIEGPLEACYDEGVRFNARAAMRFGSAPSLNWWLISNEQDTVWQSNGAPTTSIGFRLNHPPGIYRVLGRLADPTDACNDFFMTTIEIRALPDAPTDILGPRTICPGQWYTYEALGIDGDNTVEWQVFNGNSSYRANGRKINVRWQSRGPRSLNVTQANNRGPDCTSDPFRISIDPILSIEVTGKETVCREEIISYSATDYPAESYEWTIDPPTAGVITTDPTLGDIQVQWYQLGTAELTAEVCGRTHTLQVEVSDWPNPVVTHPVGLCPGTRGNVQADASYSSYRWINESDVVVSTAPSPDLEAGRYRLEVSNAAGCVGDTIFFIEPYPAPFVRISVPIFEALCPGGPPVRIHALMTEDGYSYQWYKDGVAVGTDQPTYDTDRLGIYWVEVVDQNGCIGVSNRLNLSDCEAIGGTCVNGRCVGSPPPPCVFSGDLDFEIRRTTDCRRHLYVNNSFGFIPGSIRWDFGDVASGPNNRSTDFSPEHTFEGGARFYVIKLRASFRATDGSICPIELWKNDTIPLVADFEALGACSGSDVQFNDLSNFLPFTSIVSWKWNFGDPASGAQNVSRDTDPIHVYNSPGTYTVELLVEEQSGCRSAITKQVTIYDPPTIDFDPPDENCISNAMNFRALVSPRVTKVAWDFGDPASGASNQSESFNTYHSFSNPGRYTVELRAEDQSGCKSVTSRVIEVTGNSLTAAIDASPNPPVCSGDSVVLSADTNGPTLLWSTGANSSSITVRESDVYSLTVSDAEGCVAKAPPIPVDFTELPEATIRAVRYNQFKSPAAYFYDSYAVCEGEDVFLEVDGVDRGYIYRWSTGLLGTEVEFSEENDKLLEAGDHLFTLTVTDRQTRCENTIGPFLVRVHPLPDSIEILASDARTICESTPVTYFVNNPQAGITYIWNNGETGTSMTTDVAGEYYVLGFNANGCRAESNRMIIKAGPNVVSIPSGCHIRCRPDTLCFPEIPGIASYQWYFNGAIVPGPEGQQPDFLPQESGAYYLEMIDTSGCLATSADLTIQLNDGLGTINGEVYFDLNQNGMIDAGDTLMSGIPIVILNDGMVAIDSAFSNGGLVLFDRLPSSKDYSLILDSLGLPPNTRAIQVQQDASLFGCDDEELVQWLVIPYCVTQTHSLALLACPGDSATYDGQRWAIGSRQDVTFLTSGGCDSIVSLQVNALPEYLEQVNLTACLGSRITYNGMDLPSDTTAMLRYQTVAGCDSLIEVRVSSLPRDSSSLSLEVCGDNPVDYDGVTLRAGDRRLFNYTNSSGCDSLLFVLVDSVPEYYERVALTACAGSRITYNGMDLPSDTMAMLRYQTVAGCDSLIEVRVSSLPRDSSSMSLEVCGDNPVDYDGVTLRAGDRRLFNYTNSAGCDSLLLVLVDSVPEYYEQVALTACTGSRITYNGMDLPSDTTAMLRYQTVAGCDSLIEVRVSSLPRDSSSMSLEVCGDNPVDYDGVTLRAGDRRLFNYTNSAGCDSLLLVVVDSVPEYNTYVALEACEGSRIDFGGMSLPSDTTFRLRYRSVLGCDSLVSVEVQSLGRDSSGLELEVCGNNSITYQGISLQAGDQHLFRYNNSEDCDSLIMVNVSAVPEYFEQLDLTACSGSRIDYAGMSLPADTSLLLRYKSISDCDSLIAVRVIPLPTDSMAIRLEACENGSIRYLGQELNAGEEQTFRLTNQSGCDSLVHVIVESVPLFNQTVELEACQGDFVEFGGQMLPPDTSVTFTYQTVMGCDSVIQVDVQPLASHSDTLDLETCEGTAVVYQGRSIQGGDSYLFNFTNQDNCDSLLLVRVSEVATDTSYLPLDVCPGDSITYEGRTLFAGDTEVFELKDVDGCDSFVVLSISAHPDFDVSLESEKKVCLNESDGRINISTQGGMGPFRYSLDNSRYQTPSYFERLEAGDYRVYVRDGNGCVQEQTISLEEIPPLDLRTEDAIMGCEMDTMVLSVDVLSDTTGVSYIWQDGSKMPYFTVYEPGIYWVEASNQCETVFREILVAQGQESPESPIYMPNAFSPNDDGYNDYYRGYAASGVYVIDYELQIFDRWGNKLFESHDIASGWNGVFDGQDMDPAVFVWFIRAKINSCGTELDLFQKGGVTLLR